MPKKKPAVRAQPLIAVRNVIASSRWYAQLLGLTADALDEESTHDNTYNRLRSGDQLLLQLHSWDDEDHPNLTGEHDAKHGHGVLLWFEVDDFDDAVKRARKLKAKVLEEPHENPGPQHREIWLQDPDGYTVVVVSPDGELA